MNNFDASRSGSGTREWSEQSCNIGLGCENGCLYCYARYQKVEQAKVINTWHMERILWYKVNKTEKHITGVTMFPTQHDISMYYLPAVEEKLKQLLAAGNKILIVTKPKLDVFIRLLDFLKDKKAEDKILFRISITSLDKMTSMYWEPGASAPAERVHCLRMAHEQGFQTSVSVEPLLPGPTSYAATALSIYLATEPYISDTIWFGTLNKADIRIKGITPAQLDNIRQFQRPEMVLELVRQLSPPQLYPKVRWKDSVTKIINDDIRTRGGVFNENV